MKFEIPELKIIEFDEDDVIRTSNGEPIETEEDEL